MVSIPSPIRSLSLSPSSTITCTVGLASCKIFNVESRSPIHSVPLPPRTYCLTCAFVADGAGIVIGTKEGKVLVVDVASGEVCWVEEGAHEGAVWASAVSPEGDNQSVVTGGADKDVKFWVVEKRGEPTGREGGGESSSEDDDDDDDDSDSDSDGNSEGGNVGSNSKSNSKSKSALSLVHVRTLKLTDDILSLRFSNTLDSSKLLLFVSTLDSTVKAFFSDTLKFFLSLYGHSLPVLAVGSTSDDAKLITGSADKTIKVWGLDFGDCHRSLYGHSAAVTAIEPVDKSHNFFSASKDKTVRYWDADKFEQILLLNGHVGEVYGLALAKSGGFLLSGGMDRQVRVWERTRDMVFVEEEREKELEEKMNKADDAAYNSNGALGSRFVPGRLADGKEEGGEGGGDMVTKAESQLAVKKSVITVAAGDRIFEAIELADSETKEIVSTMKANVNRKSRGEKEIPIRKNLLLMGMEPARYLLWVLRSVNVGDLEQALMILPIIKVERLVFYLINLLRNNLGIELCCKIAIFMVKVHQKQVSGVGLGGGGNL